MRANPMTFSADTASTHVGWRQSGSDADADHLLIRSDWGAGGGDTSSPSGEPVLRFTGDEPAAANVEVEVEAELDVEVNDAAVDAPPYLWGGEALVPDSISGPSETVFS